MSDHQENTTATPGGYSQDQVKEHEFDGIQEFDNRLPNWWLWILYGSMVFALIYWLVFHTLEIGQLPHARFEAHMQAAQEAQLARAAEAGLTNETFVMMSELDNRVAEGREVFLKYCMACHLDDGRGSVGPNLTDGAWVHGCEPMQMYKIVTDGVAAKGMPAWMNQLGPNRVQVVVAYILTIQGTNVPGKAPEGEPCEF